jgi:LytS/YehU family sensor histidine kinase
MTLRVPLVPGSLRRRVPLYALGGFLYTYATCLGTAVLCRILGLFDQPVLPTVARSFFAFLPSQFALFAVIVGVFHALDNRRQAEEHAQARLQLAASLTEARLHALRSQLSPHFFFNTLNAISTLTMQGRKEQVVRMVSGLGDLVRLSLDEKLPHEVPLARELELLEIYLGIQRIRFADWLRVEQEVDPRALEFLVPTLVLQPLVENAIEHGGEDVDGLHRVVIRCVLDGGVLEISVANPETTGGTAVHSVRLGVGLRNTTERLRQLHPGAHEFRHGPVAEGGFQTIVRIAARRAAASETPDVSPAGASA